MGTTETLYLESFGNPRNFVRIARRLARRKPIVALRAGRSGAGARAAASHTGAVVAASDAGIEALFAQAGIVQADTLGELFDIGALLASQEPPAGRRVAIVTNAGGPAILCADACEAGGLVLPELSEELRARAGRAVAGSRVRAEPGRHAGRRRSRGIRRRPARAGGLWRGRRSGGAVHAGAERHGGRGPGSHRRRRARRGRPRRRGGFRSGPPEAERRGSARFSYPEGAARALSAVARLAEWRQAPPDDAPAFADVRPEEATELLAAAVTDGERWLSETETSQLLEAWAVPLVETARAATPAEAGRAAAALGGPVALKAVGEGIVHKTDLGAVQTGLEGEEAVRRSAQGMSRRLRRRGLAPRGFLVQRYVTGGVEMLAGITVDPLLGPLVACAAGGTVVELIGDVSVRLAPIGPREAAEMIRSLSTFPLLDGYRGAPPADVARLGGPGHQVGRAGRRASGGGGARLQPGDGARARRGRGRCPRARGAAGAATAVAGGGRRATRRQ